MNVDGDQIRPLTQVNLFSMARWAGLRTGLAGFYWFGYFLPPSANIDEYADTIGEDQAADEEIFPRALT